MCDRCFRIFWVYYFNFFFFWVHGNLCAISFLFLTWTKKFNREMSYETEPMFKQSNWISVRGSFLQMCKSNYWIEFWQCWIEELLTPSSLFQILSHISLLFHFNLISLELTIFYSTPKKITRLEGKLQGLLLSWEPRGEPRIATALECNNLKN